MSTISLPQVKIFTVNEFKNSTELEEEVNLFIVDAFKKHGNTPIIESNSEFIMITTTQTITISEETEETEE